MTPARPFRTVLVAASLGLSAIAAVPASAAPAPAVSVADPARFASTLSALLSFPASLGVAPPAAAQTQAAPASPASPAAPAQPAVPAGPAPKPAPPAAAPARTIPASSPVTVQPPTSPAAIIAAPAPGSPIVIAPPPPPAGDLAGDSTEITLLSASPTVMDPHGYDISWPQCGGRYPKGERGYAIIGITGGRALTENKCFGEQWAWAQQEGASGYVNINSPKAEALAKWGLAGAYGSCDAADVQCQMRNVGHHQATYAVEVLRRHGGQMPPVLWLDVETLNYWTPVQADNVELIKGAIQGLRDAGFTPGLYTTKNMWREITGDWDPQVITWQPIGESTRVKAEAACDRVLAGRHPVMVQWIEDDFDNNVLCDRVDPGALFSVPVLR